MSFFWTDWGPLQPCISQKPSQSKHQLEMYFIYNKIKDIINFNVNVQCTSWFGRLFHLISFIFPINSVFESAQNIWATGSVVFCQLNNKYQERSWLFDITDAYDLLTIEWYGRNFKTCMHLGEGGRSFSEGQLTCWTSHQSITGLTFRERPSYWEVAVLTTKPPCWLLKDIRN